VYRLGWLDSVAKERDRHTGALILDRPPPEQEDIHTRAGVFLGNMMVSDITQRLREHNLPVCLFFAANTIQVPSTFRATSYT
jgi:hypothetical protein